MAALTSFDPFAQSFTLSMSDGTPFNVSMPELDDFILYNVQISINYASQLGGSLILLIVLLLLTKPDKRQSAIFIFNCLSLVINVIRNVIQCVYFTGPFSEVYAYFGQDYSRVTTSDYATSIAGTVLTTILLVCVEVSLILQVRVVCVTLRSIYRKAISIFTMLNALIAIGFRLALCIQNAKAIAQAQSEFSLHWLGSASNIAFTISICSVCAVFVIKLGIALDQRKKLGLDQFGPMKALFIMGCQTLFVPGTYNYSYPHLIAANIPSSHLLHPSILHFAPRHVLQRPHSRRHLPPSLITLGFCCHKAPRISAAAAPAPWQIYRQPRISIYRSRSSQRFERTTESRGHCSDEDQQRICTYG